MELNEHLHLDIQPYLDRAQKLGLARSNISDLTGVNQPAISRAANGACSISYPDLKKISDLLDDCEELSHRARVPIDWTKTALIREQLGQLRTQRNAPAEPLSESETALLARFSRGDEDVSEIAIDLRITVSELLERLEGLLSRCDRMAKVAAK